MSNEKTVNSPYLYQLNRAEFCKTWKTVAIDKKTGEEIEKPMGKATFYRRRDWAQKHYPQWRKVFLYGGRVDLREYQKFNAYYSDAKYEERQDPHLKYLEEI
ncbi:hypothetical protein [Limosilactobacillus oris]|uniref:hypothetical protein n=1 Tax=Limosilactobacillus oris TaxID=1632 RepID=UPI0022364313|nr:hypothetical protein [Limosilactobacillus oris]MCW4388752.1 hypothetical protein [Limosilactobacillus oris]